MNYNELTNLALKYSDRSDDETLERVDDFLRIVEARINKKVSTLKMSVRAIVPLVKDQAYYGLPSDFKGVRDIQLNDNDGVVTETLHYLTPERLNDLKVFPGSDDLSGGVYYTFIADQLQIKPSREDGQIEIVYYQRIPQITDINNTNWIGDDHPDLYTFGLIVEVSAFAKDYDAAARWDARFMEALNDLSVEDTDIRWSGVPLQMRADR